MWKQLCLFNENDQKVIIEQEPGADDVMQVHFQEDELDGDSKHTFLMYLDLEEARELGKELIHFADDLEGTRRTEINI